MGKRKKRMSWLGSFLAGAVIALSLAELIVLPIPSSLKDTRDAVRQIVAHDDYGTGFCSGVMIAPKVMLTAGHCTHDEKSLEVNGHPATVIRSEFDEKGHDLALLRVDAGCPCAILSDSNPVLDEAAIAVGYPIPEAVYVETVTRGHIEGTHAGRIISDAPIAPGNSGGGLFVMRYGRWALAGIVVEVVTMPGNPMGPGSLTTISRSVSLKEVECFIDGLKC